MAKKRHMRWTDEGAHCLVQVRVAELNGELSVSRIANLPHEHVWSDQKQRRAA